MNYHRHAYPFQCPVCQRTVTRRGCRGMCEPCAQKSRECPPCVKCGAEEVGARTRGMCGGCYQAAYYLEVTKPLRELQRIIRERKEKVTG